MIDPVMGRALSRRSFLKAGGLVIAAGLGAGTLGALSPGSSRAGARPQPKPDSYFTRILSLAGTDGWMSLPTGTQMPNNPVGTPGQYYPDPMAPDGLQVYAYGFRDVTGYTKQTMFAQKGRMQNAPPILCFDEHDRIKLTLSNLGWAQRPDIPDGHTIHWHGFRNAIPYFDGVPEMSGGAPINKEYIYYYEPVDAGTYMYHCHWEDVEHVQMGMTSIVFVRPAQNGTAKLFGGRTYTKFAYNDGDGSTGYDREFSFMLQDYDVYAHWQLAHIQQPDWSNYRASAWLMNGRSYPDTVAPNTTFDANGDPRDLAGNPLDPAAGDHLAFQPISSLITANAGERVLVRMASLGYQAHAMTMPGIPLHVIGRDATILRGGADSTGADTSYTTDTLVVSPGEAYDAIFEAPPHSGGSGPDVYQFFDRNYADNSNGSSSGLGGMRTEVHVYPATGPDALREQRDPVDAPNDQGL